MGFLHFPGRSTGILIEKVQGATKIKRLRLYRTQAKDAASELLFTSWLSTVGHSMLSG